MADSSRFDFCPKCGALSRDGVCQSCGYVNQDIIKEMEAARAQATVQQPYAHSVNTAPMQSPTGQAPVTQGQPMAQQPYAQAPNAQQPNMQAPMYQSGYGAVPPANTRDMHLRFRPHSPLRRREARRLPYAYWQESYWLRWLR